MLGKVFGAQHRRIRHVPYVPRVGFTETHRVFLTQVDAVIAVSCESDGNVDKQANSAKQRDFIRAVATALTESDHGSPMVSVSFGSGDSWEWEDDLFNHVWAGEMYDEDSAMNARMLVFGPPK